MDRDLLSHLPVVVTVARRGGFAAAATELGMSPSAVSHAVRIVEERMGTPLFARTTRSVALTEAGQTLVEGVGAALVAINETSDRVRTRKGKASGLLRLNVPRVALPLVVTPLVEMMTAQLPDVTVETFIDDGLVDIVAEGFDAGVRVGAMIAEDMVTVRLTPPFWSIIVATPGYLAARGTPRTIDDLKDHNCVNYRLIQGRGIYRWELETDGRDVAVETRGTVITNDTLHARDLARRGVGLAYLFEPTVREDLKSGRLVQVLARHAAREQGLFLYFPRRAADAPKLRALIDVARAFARSQAA